MSEAGFAQVYRRFLALVAQPQPVREAAAALASRDAKAAPLVGWVAADSDEQAAARLGIYAHMYFARLRDSLHEDYESFAALVGDEAFERIAARYLVQHPSDSPSLRYHGRHFPEFLRRRRDELERLVGTLRPDLADLCALEWARIEVFDAPEVELLSAEMLAGLAEQDWPHLELELVPAQRLLTSDYAVTGLWSAAARRETAPALDATPSSLLVWRRGFAAYHRAVPADEAQALGLLQAKVSFADLCQSLAEGCDAESAVARTLQLLRQWLVDELLVAPSSLLGRQTLDPAGRRR